MKITVNKSRAEVSWEIAKMARDAVAYGVTDGYAVMNPADIPGFIDEWNGSEHPFGREAWKVLRKEFPSSVKTDEGSVHHGQDLPDHGIAVLDAGEFSVVLVQVIDDRGWREWHWKPLAVVAAA